MYFVRKTERSLLAALLIAITIHVFPIEYHQLTSAIHRSLEGKAVDQLAGMQFEANHSRLYQNLEIEPCHLLVSSSSEIYQVLNRLTVIFPTIMSLSFKDVAAAYISVLL